MCKNSRKLGSFNTIKETLIFLEQFIRDVLNNKNDFVAMTLYSGTSFSKAFNTIKEALILFLEQFIGDVKRYNDPCQNSEKF